MAVSQLDGWHHSIGAVAWPEPLRCGGQGGDDEARVGEKEEGLSGCGGIDLRP